MSPSQRLSLGLIKELGVLLRHRSVGEGTVLPGRVVDPLNGVLRQRSRRSSGRRLGRRRRWLAGFTAFGTVAIPMIMAAFAAAAGEGGIYTYDVRLSGQTVGRHQLAFFRQNARTEVEAVSEAEVRFAFVPVFRFEHRRREVWENGRPVYIRATTDNDGDRYDITLRESGDGIVRTVNGEVDRFDRPIKALTLWDRDVIRHDAFVSVIDGKVVSASFEYRGRQDLSVGGQTIEAEHYRMTGDVDRDVWFDPNGHVVNVVFWEGGAKIEIVRNEPAWRPLDDRLFAALSGQSERR